MENIERVGAPTLCHFEGDCVSVAWDNINCEISRIYQHTRGEVSAELHITNKAGDHIMRHHFTDMASDMAKKRIAKDLIQIHNHVDWLGILEICSEKTLAFLRAEHDAFTIDDFSTASPPDFLLWPFLVKHENNMIFAPGGGGKSYLALLWLIMLEYPLTNNPFGWTITNKPTSCLYWDWERSLNTQKWRMNRLLNGLDIPVLGTGRVALHYDRVHQPLKQQVRNAQYQINKTKAGLFIVDSAGMACGAGNMNETGPAQNTFDALGALHDTNGNPMTTLILAHTSKDPNTSKKTPYGNAYWSNECSSIWELEPVTDADHNIKTITLKCHKHNDYAWQKDIGLTFTMDADAAYYSLCEPPIKTEKTNSLVNQAANVLMRGRLSTSKLIGEMGLSGSNAKNLTSLLARDDRFKNFAEKGQEGFWGVVSEQTFD